MQMLTRKYYLTIISLLLLVTACAGPTARIAVLRPAAVNLSGMKKIAVGHMKGRGGRHIEAILAEQLVQTNYFEVMNTGRLGRVLEDSNLDLINLVAMINPDTAAKFRESLGVDIIATGEVTSYRYVQSNTKGDRRREKDNKEHRNFCKKGRAFVTANFRITNLRDGSTLFLKTVSASAEGRTSAEDKWPVNPNKSALLQQASRQAVATFVREIAPHSEVVTVRFAKNETKLPEMQNGINYARAGQWGNAAEQFETAVRKEPYNQGAWYNLGLAYEYTCRFNEAESAFKKATEIQPCQQCIYEINNVRRLAGERNRLKEQGAI
jgi:curli biogenesis system outer membrane secretion channel CsgG